MVHGCGGPQLRRLGEAGAAAEETTHGGENVWHCGVKRLWNRTMLAPGNVTPYFAHPTPIHPSPEAKQPPPPQPLVLLPVAVQVRAGHEAGAVAAQGQQLRVFGQKEDARAGAAMGRVGRATPAAF